MAYQKWILDQQFRINFSRHSLYEEPEAAHLPKLWNENHKFLQLKSV